MNLNTDIEIKNTNQKGIRCSVASANRKMFIFSLVYYGSLTIAYLIRYFMEKGSIAHLLPTIGMLALVPLQVYIYQIFPGSYKFGLINLLAFSAEYTWMNLAYNDNATVLSFLPVALLYVLYFNKYILMFAYSIWILNAVFHVCITLYKGELVLGAFAEFAIEMLVGVALGAIVYIICNSLDRIYETFDEMNKLKKQYYKQANEDSTTGLLNRNAYNVLVNEYKAYKYQSVSCIYIDVNGLHEYNNSYGHQAGDHMLRVVAREIKKNFKGDRHYRIGGDEFVVVCENDSRQIAQHKFDTFRDCIKRRRVHVAMGMEWREEDINLKDMATLADERMYADKESFYLSYPGGRDNMRLYVRAVD